MEIGCNTCKLDKECFKPKWCIDNNFEFWRGEVALHEVKDWLKGGMKLGNRF